MEVVQIEEIINKILKSDDFTFLDVRSENEYLQGHFLKSHNVPILNNEHRHLVGLCYKEKGNELAKQLGHKLVDPIRPKLVDRWIRVLSSNNKKLSFLYCWRGGLRSQISQEWLKDGGVDAVRVKGGFKSIRGWVLNQFQNYPNCIVVGGATGTGKTQLLNEFSSGVDIEGLAGHRGSSFGLFLGESQPAQVTFECSMAFELAKKNSIKPILLEDESKLVGKIVLPPGLYKHMSTSQFVIVVSSVNERAKHIFDLYIKEPIRLGTDKNDLKNHFIGCTKRISKKLGGLTFQKIINAIEFGFANDDIEAHLNWISLLLTEYYDPRYLFAQERKNIKPLFVGSKDEVREFLKEQLC